MQTNEITGILNRPISQELLARDVTRLAYVAKDGTPRNIPIIFACNGYLGHERAFRLVPTASTARPRRDRQPAQA